MGEKDKKRMEKTNRIIANASGSSGNSLVIYDDRGKYLLLDVGLQYNEIIKKLDYNLKDCSGVCVTHCHSDHCKGLDNLISKAIPCYGNQDVCDRHKGCNLLPKVLKVDGFKIQHFELEHNVPNTAFVVDLDSGIRVLYITDTKSVSKRVKNVNYAIVECNYDDEVIIDNMVNDDMSHSRPENHLCLDDCIDYLKQIYSPALQCVVLWHLSDSNIDASKALARVKEELGFDNVYIARKGLEIELTKEEF